MSADAPTPRPRGGFAKIGAVFQRKVLGVKVLYWTALFVGVLAFYAWRMRSDVEVEAAGDAAAPTGDELASGEDVAGDGAAYVSPYSGLTGGGTVVVAQPDTAIDPDLANQSITSNVEWTTRGVAFLQSSQNVPGTVALNALQAYLDGKTLSTTQRRYVDAVISELGTPPFADMIGGVGDGTRTLVRYIRPAGRQAVYAQYSDNTLWLLSSPEYTALGRPKFVDVPLSDPVWQFPRFDSRTGKKMGGTA